MNSKSDFDQLRMAGFNNSQIAALCRLRNKYDTPSRKDQAPVNFFRLVFVRWFVGYKRVTDSID
ncbi:MAG TPA: hypothetical protein VL461_02840 [Dictyobacter sp.]|jgi:hypothetical protein|nr:hypothetical protein [Dictyobacter sp.]